MKVLARFRFSREVPSVGEVFRVVASKEHIAHQSFDLCNRVRAQGMPLINQVEDAKEVDRPSLFGSALSELLCAWTLPGSSLWSS